MNTEQHKFYASLYGTYTSANDGNGDMTYKYPENKLELITSRSFI
jgi:hypothetical protein